MDEGRVRFEELFNRHYGSVMRYAARRVGADQAADVVSETFLVAWRRLAQVPTADPLPWLYKTARNVIGNQLRSRTRLDRLIVPLDERTDTVEGDHADLVVDRTQIVQALAGLSERDQEALLLAAWEGLSVSEAATVMECSRVAYKVRLHRARRRLIAALGNPETNDDPGSVFPSLAHEGES